MRRLWLRTVALGFRLLYNQLSWLYDPVSWLASGGLWRRWQETALPFLPPPGARVLELGFGPGHLLVDMAVRGYQVAGLDLSPAMVRRARRRLGRVRPPATGWLLCRGRAAALPFAPGSFDVVVATFPTAYVADLAFLAGLTRVLRTGGRLVVVQEAVFGPGTGIAGRALEWLYGVTGQRGPGAPGLPERLEAAGFRAWRETVPVEATAVRLILATLPGN